MFNTTIYQKRRTVLQNRLSGGIVVFFGNQGSPMNYMDNTYRFRQDSTFLYYFGIDEPGISVVMDMDASTATLFADEMDVDDIIWMGRLQTFREKAELSGLSSVLPSDRLGEVLNAALKNKRKIHFLNPYRAEHVFLLQDLLGLSRKEITGQYSKELTLAVVNQRNVKGPEEIEEIEKAHDATRLMHVTAMRMAKPGLLESEISGRIEGIALSQGAGVSFPVILSVRGEILHNHTHTNRMQNGDLLVNDSGAESFMHYAADITRTFPVSGLFTTRQREVYEIVLRAQMESIGKLKPDIHYKEVHLNAARIIAEGLKDLGLMKGDIGEAVEQGAHALFFPHGLGHMMGLDVHDMENLGEQFVGYEDNLKRSDQFGLAYLRLARDLKPGFVLTVEPGIYFIPELIAQWKKTNKFENFIDYSKVETYLGFGGIRIEDDVLITKSGNRVLGHPIPKSVSDIEAICRENQ